MKPRTSSFQIPRWGIAFCLALLPLAGSALIISSETTNVVSDPGWPQGTMAVANLSSRVGWWEGPPIGGGEWQFLYRGNTAAFAVGMTNFAAIRAPALELVLHDEPQTNAFFNGEFEWTFTIWVPAAWHRLYNDPKSPFSWHNRRFPVDPPRLDLYLGPGSIVDWSRVRVPPGIAARDERASTRGVRQARIETTAPGESVQPPK